MIAPVIWKSYNPDSPSQGYWDQGLIKDLIENKLWRPIGDLKLPQFPNGFVDHWSEYEDGSQDGSILIIPARSNAEYIDQINRDIKKFKWVIIMLTGDEENVFPKDKLEHDRMIVYVMSPREDLDLTRYRVLGTGYPPHMRESLEHDYADKRGLDFFFSGQITHGRREEMRDNLKNVSTEENDLTGWVNYTDGFTKGVEPDYYYAKMSHTKVAICPSGPETPDTFRLFEALEAGAVPIADTLVSKGGFTNKYWNFFFGEQPPFPIIENYNDLRGYIEDIVVEYPARNNRVYAWWQSKKRDMAYQLKSDIEALSGESVANNSVDDDITVIIPVSPIKSHPRTYILDETIESIRHHLPNAEIIVTFDGVRPENEDKRCDYEEFIERMLWKFNYHHHNILPVIFDEHLHQTGMAKAVLDKVKTPLLLYVEQDTPLVTDEPINWEDCRNMVWLGEADVIRFHHEAVIPKEHEYMMHGVVLKTGTTPFMRTSQWSQRPHLSTVGFYRRILETCFSPDAKSFIEDKMHGVCAEAWNRDGRTGWLSYKLMIYYPKGNIKRSYHTDGRAGEAKYDDTQVF